MKPHAKRRRLAAAVSAATAAAVLLAGCGMFNDSSSSGDASPGKAPTPSGTGPYPEPAEPTPAPVLPSGKAGEPHGGIPSPADVDQADATAVSRAALTALSTYDTALDTSLNDAGRRTADAGWCTAGYAAQLREAVHRAVPGAEWQTWTQHRAYATVKLSQTEDAGRPADSDTTAYRQWTITVTPTGRDGWKGTPTTTVAYAELTRTGAGQPWRLNTVTLQQ
ncbi:hypothetical protein [Streptomyces pseudovenezuelae]|uniref:hypothetical protein n=1 Tax=Streptomyces pseudovenezuelae TaxID=67350 RepID=UPI0036E2FC41